MLRAALEDECARRLAVLGFRAGKKPSFLIDLAPGFQGVLILPWKSYTRHVVVGLFPSVGVVDLELEAEIKRHGGRLVPTYATYQTPLINLVPDKGFPNGAIDLLFDDAAEGDRAMDWFLEAIGSIGIPWMARLTRNNELAIEIFRADHLPGRAADFDIGIEAALLELRFGHPDRARARLDRHVAAMEERRDAIGDGFRAFAADLHRELDEQRPRGEQEPSIHVRPVVQAPELGIELPAPYVPYSGPRVILSTTREGLVRELLSYDEDAVAAAVRGLGMKQLEEIWILAAHYAFRPPEAGGLMLSAKALALAAVEVVEGTGRPLRRSRRRLK